MLTITIAIILLTCIISFTSFSNEKLMNDLIFYPPAITHHNQWYRFVTCGLIHADIAHLGFNMYSFYMFGEIIEEYFSKIYGEKGKVMFLILYVSALVVCLLPTYFNNKENYHYRSLGASGAVSAIVFAFIFLAPLQGIGLMFIPVHFPAFIFGIVYLIVSAYLANRGESHINHSAHFWGAVYGIIFLIVTCQFLSDFRPIDNFIFEIKSYFS
ncbi:MAG: rhomboid family intramembrane serine protease [Bacteroidota bacterium]|nr:rhomboid family intramembrane serine protease [Bacteroidota bacterium]